MKKLFLWICLLSFSFFATDAMANLPEMESAKAENSNLNNFSHQIPANFT
ncbi:MAG: hypothetical protein K0B11_22430 [Mariniphaga sp.]|nr:hypothetical protein [Mariniphaga sp.]